MAPEVNRSLGQLIYLLTIRLKDLELAQVGMCKWLLKPEDYVDLQTNLPGREACRSVMEFLQGADRAMTRHALLLGADQRDRIAAEIVAHTQAVTLPLNRIDEDGIIMLRNLIEVRTDQLQAYLSRTATADEITQLQYFLHDFHADALAYKTDLVERKLVLDS